MSEVELLPGHVARLGLGTLPHEDLASLPGLEILRRLAAGDYPAPPMAGLMRFTISEVAEGRAVFIGRPDASHLNPVGAVHGGWAATIMDSALACCVQTTLRPGESFTTAEFKINFLRPITPATGQVSCEGVVVHRGRTLAVSEARLTDGAGRLLAFGTETCSIFPATSVAKPGRRAGEP